MPYLAGVFCSQHFAGTKKVLSQRAFFLEDRTTQFGGKILWLLGGKIKPYPLIHQTPPSYLRSGLEDCLFFSGVPTIQGLKNTQPSGVLAGKKGTHSLQKKFPCSSLNKQFFKRMGILRSKCSTAGLTCLQ